MGFFHIRIAKPKRVHNLIRLANRRTDPALRVFEGDARDRCPKQEADKRERLALFPLALCPPARATVAEVRAGREG